MEASFPGELQHYTMMRSSLNTDQKYLEEAGVPAVNRLCSPHNNIILLKQQDYQPTVLRQPLSLSSSDEKGEREAYFPSATSQDHQGYYPPAQGAVYSKKQESWCCIGLRAPGAMVRACNLGIEPGDIGNVPRYIFFVVQNVLILAGICVSFAAPFDPVAYNYLRIGALFMAFAVNVVERLTFWLHHAHSNYKYCILWNLRADFIRLLTTEILICMSLILALYTTSPCYLNWQLPKGDYLKNGYTVVGIIAFLYLLTLLALKTFILLNLSRPIIKHRVARDPNAATFQRRLLIRLCGNTCIWPWVKVEIVALIWLFLQSPRSSFLFLPAMLFNIVPMGLWLLYILDTFPWTWFFPASVLYGPQEFSPLYQKMHNLVITFMINRLRPIVSEFWLFVLLVTIDIFIILYSHL